MNRIAIDFTDVEIFLDFGDLFRLYAVGNTPYLFWRGVVVVSELLPVGALYEGDDAARCFRRASMVLAA